MNSEDQKVYSVDYVNCSEDEHSGTVKKKTRIDTCHKSSPLQLTVAVGGDTVESSGGDNSASPKDDRLRESESEPEEGEITDSQSEKSYDGDSSSGHRESSEASDDDGE